MDLSLYLCRNWASQLVVRAALKSWAQVLPKYLGLQVGAAVPSLWYFGVCVLSFKFYVYGCCLHDVCKLDNVCRCTIL